MVFVQSKVGRLGQASPERANGRVQVPRTHKLNLLPSGTPLSQAHLQSPGLSTLGVWGGAEKGGHLDETRRLALGEG